MLAGAHQRKQNSHNFWRVGTLTILATFIFSLGFAVAGRENAHATSPAEPNTWTLLAAGNKDEVFKSTSSNTSTGNNTSNGAFWYNYSGRAIGFSPTNTINIARGTTQHQIDTQNLSGCNSGNQGDLRLSAALYTGDREYYWYVTRIGCVETYNYPTATSVIGYYEADNPTYYPSGPQVNVSRATLIAGGWTLCAITDLRGATERQNHVITPCDKAKILMAGHSSPPTNSIPPKVTGTYSVGSTLTATDGTWADVTGATTARQWQSSSDGVTWTDISGAINSTYILTSSESGKYIRFKITKTISDGSLSAYNVRMSGTKISGTSVFSNSTIYYRDTNNVSTEVTASTQYNWISCNGGPGNIGVKSGQRLIVNLNSPRDFLTVNLFGNNLAQEFKVIYLDGTSSTYTQASPIYAVTPPENTYADLKFPVNSAQDRGGHVNVPLTAPADTKISGFEILWTTDVWTGCSGIYGFADPTYYQLPAVVSQPPTGLSAIAGNGSATVSFTAPSSNGGANISNYKYSTNGSTYTALNPADATSPITIPGLTNGTTYSITLKAVNSAGDSTASTAVSVTPFGAPGTPDLDAASDLGTSNTDNSTSDDTPTLSVSSLLSGANVTFTATPSSGSPVTCSFTSTGTSGSCTFTSLSNATYSITAVQSFGGVNSDTSTALANVVINKIAISTPATPDLADSSDSGSSNNDNVTKNKRPTINVSGSFTGTATVTATKGSTNVICTISSGTCTFASDLADGVWSITASIIDTAGNISASSEALSITIDTIAPTKPSISSQFATNNMTIPVQSSEIGIAYLASNTSLEIDYLTSANDEFWNSTPITVANTPTDLSTSGFRTGYWYSYYVTDIAGNISARSDNYVMIAAADPPYFGSPTRPTSSTPADAVGSTLTNVMSANGVPTPTITYQYVRCPSVSGDWVPTCVNIPGATSSTYTLTTDDVGQHIGVRITATNSQGTRSQLGVATAQVTAAVPGSPTSVSATITGSTTASVSFTAPASNGGAAITDYDLEYSSNSGSTWTSFNNGTSTTNPILVTGLTAKTSYIFRVKAKNSTGFGSFSIESSPQTTLMAPTVVTNEGPQNLASPGVFKVGDTLTNQMTFDGFPTPTIAYQYVRCPSVSGDWVPTCVDIPGATSSTYTLTADDVGKYVGLKITATNSSGNIVRTPTRNTIVAAANPGAPTSVSATITGSTTASVAFTAPASNGASITDYDLEYSSNSGSAWTSFSNGTSTANPILVTGLTANTSYIFRVKAKNSAGDGSFSVASSVQTTHAAPTIASTLGTATFPRLSNDVFEEFEGPGPSTGITVTVNGVTTPISTDPATGNVSIALKASSWTSTATYGSLSGYMLNFYNSMLAPDITFTSGVSQFRFLVAGLAVQPTILLTYTNGTSDTLTLNTGGSEGAPYVITITAPSGKFINSFRITPPSQDWWHLDNISYVAALSTTTSVSSQSLTAGTAVTSFTPITASGGGSSKTYSISPSLPSGLSLNTSTGAITGTPTGATASTSYTVSVTDGSSNSSATFTLGVNAALSSSAGTVPSGVYKDVAVTAFTPVSFSGGTSPVTYSVSPSLPAGLSLNTSTGVISGTATGTSPNTTYTVTATDANGDTEASTFAFAVTDAPTAPGAPTIGAATSTGQTTATVAFTAPANTGGAAITTYTVTASPGGITATGSSSPITVTGLTAGTAYTFSITATNAGGLTSTSSSPSSSITTETAPVQNNNNGGGGGGGGGAPAPAPEPAPEPVCNAACVAAQNAAAKAAADKVAAEKAAAEKLTADKAAAVAVAEKTKVDVSAAATAATAAVEKATAAAAAKVDVDTVAAAVSTIVNSTNSSAAITNKITNEAAASISSAPAAATKAASTASANTKANSAASQVRAAATAAQKAATSSQAQTSAAPEISLGSSNTGSAAAQAAARANAAARAGKAAANEVAATAEAKAVESKATATALQNEANAAVAEAIAEQKVATALAVEAKAAADKASTLSAEKITATTAVKTAAEILVELLKEKVTVAEKIAAAVTVEALAEAQKSLDTVNAKIAEAERTVAETASKADAAISAQVEAVRVAEAAKASAEAQLAKVDQLNAVVPVKAAAAVRAASVAAVDTKIATAAKAAAAKVPSKAVISAKPGASTGKNSTRATISGLKPGQKVKVTVNVKPKP